MAYEPINRLDVFKRDGFRCQIRGCKTLKSKIGTTHRRAPELDHRVPMSRGGGHVWANVQTACRECNGTKGNANSKGQTDLFPNPREAAPCQT